MCRRARRTGPGLLALPVVRPDRGPHLLRARSLVRESATLLPRRRQPTIGAAAVLRVGDPCDPRVRADCGMVGIHEDHLVVLVHPVLPDPVRRQHLEVRVPLRGPLLGDPLDRFRHRDLEHAAPPVAGGASPPPPFPPSCAPRWAAPRGGLQICAIKRYRRARAPMPRARRPGIPLPYSYDWRNRSAPQLWPGPF